MALIVETGLIVANANSYISLSDAATYHTLYGNLDWVATDADLEQALINACMSMELLYGPRYLSEKVYYSTQSLLFPRMYFYDNNFTLVPLNTIPPKLKQAQAELALMSLNGVNLFPEENPEAGIMSQSVKVTDFSKSTTYLKPQLKEEYVGFRKIDLILAALLKSKTQNLTLKR